MILKQLVNDKVLYDAFQKELDTRINFAYKQIEQRDEPLELHRLQGEIKALRSLKMLRDKINGERTETF
jgi:hypothetical protein|tara:strand:+ start:157 stop:363 length:207 start_codon:yes stop_codon:yes gene_type:complete